MVQGVLSIALGGTRMVVALHSMAGATTAIHCATIAKVPGALSIVIPTSDRRASLDRLIQSIDNEPGTCALEIFVVNDAATGTLHLPEHIRVLHSGGKGPAHARNLGAVAARGDLLLFLDDDSIAPAGYVRRVLETAERLREGYAFAGPQRCLAGATYAAEASRTLLDWFMFHEAVGERRFLPSNGLAVYRADFERAGGFNESYTLAAGEDRDLSLRLREASVTLVLDPSLALLHDFPPTVRDLLRQQWRYGRGAYQYAKRFAGGRLEPRSARAYLSLLREAIRRKGPALAFLCAAAQLMVLGGFLWERSANR